MGLEIEHKYLVKDLSFKELSSKCYSITQGYLSREKGRTVRVRLCDDKAYITIKSSRQGATRHEYEYEIPYQDGEELIALCPQPVLKKNRYIVMHNGCTWEVDEFLDQFEGLITAEIELDSEDQSYDIPGFVGKNVSDDHRYSNSRLGQCEIEY